MLAAAMEGDYGDDDRGGGGGGGESIGVESDDGHVAVYRVAPGPTATATTAAATGLPSRSHLLSSGRALSIACHGL